MLHELYFPFSLIGLTETKLKHNQHSISNVTLKGYRFVSQPSNPNAGGVGFFVKDNIKHTLRIDLTVTKNEFEALWVEVQNDSQHNYVVWYYLQTPQQQSWYIPRSTLALPLKRYTGKISTAWLWETLIWIFWNLNLMLERMLLWIPLVLLSLSHTFYSQLGSLIIVLTHW